MSDKLTRNIKNTGHFRGECNRTVFLDQIDRVLFDYAKLADSLGKFNCSYLFESASLRTAILIEFDSEKETIKNLYSSYQRFHNCYRQLRQGIAPIYKIKDMQSTYRSKYPIYVDHPVLLRNWRELKNSLQTYIYNHLQHEEELKEFLNNYGLLPGKFLIGMENINRDERTAINLINNTY